MKENRSGTDAANGFTKDVKMVLVGGVGVGKTSIATRITKDEFKDYYETTIGAAFASKTVETNRTTLKFNIWDTAGQERYKSMVPMYYRGASVAIVVYDLTDDRSLAKARQWIDELRELAPRDIIIFLAGNKLDLALENRAVQTENGAALATAHDLLFAEISAKTGLNVGSMFNSIVRAITDGKGGKGNTQQRNGLKVHSCAAHSKKKCAC